jgi:hypothetical protein
LIFGVAILAITIIDISTIATAIGRTQFAPTNGNKTVVTDAKLNSNTKITKGGTSQWRESNYRHCRSRCTSS